jgi:hypothetical protein
VAGDGQRGAGRGSTTEWQVACGDCWRVVCGDCWQVVCGDCWRVVCGDCWRVVCGDCWRVVCGALVGLWSVLGAEDASRARLWEAEIDAVSAARDRHDPALWPSS